MSIAKVVWDIDLSVFIGKAVRVRTSEGLVRNGRVERFTYERTHLDGGECSIPVSLVLTDGTELPVAGATITRVKQ